MSMLRSLFVGAALVALAAPAAAVEMLSATPVVLHSDRLGIGGIEFANLPERLDSRPTAVPGVPEPGTWALMLAGFGLVGAVVRRRFHLA